MDLVGKLEQIRQKPEAARQRLTLFWSAGITLVILAGWLFTLRYTFATPAVTASTTVEQPADTNPGFFDRISNGATVVVDQVKNIFK